MPASLQKQTSLPLRLSIQGPGEFIFFWAGETSKIQDKC
jgi:hypothetical protein